MTDFVPCPTCGGRAVVPIDRVADLTATDLERMIERGRKQLAALEHICEDPPPTRPRELRAEP